MGCNSLNDIGSFSDNYLTKDAIDFLLSSRALTSDNRDNWAEAYKLLLKDNQNQESIDDIENSLFLMCLDEDMSQIPAYDNQSRSALQSLHGLLSTENRWNDKALQV